MDLQITLQFVSQQSISQWEVILYLYPLLRNRFGGSKLIITMIIVLLKLQNSRKKKTKSSISIEAVTP